MSTPTIYPGLDDCLSKQTQSLHLPAQDRVSFPFAPIQNGDILNIGSARLIALHSPGHTNESTSYLLEDQVLFSGDTLFLGSVGRPDLEASAGEARVRASLLYRSLQQILGLSSETLILPGHTKPARPI